MGRQQSSSADGLGAGDLADAHRELLQDRTLQFDVERYRPTEPPKWAGGLAEALLALGPGLQILFWSLVALAVIGILYVIARNVLGVRFGERPGRGPALGPEPDWRPTAQQAQVLLADADALAADGRFDEAAHLLLLRGVQDIRDQRPGVVRPALTSRDIAALEVLPDAARSAFGAIAQIVERSFFGGRAVGPDGWRICRAAYETFALGGGA